MGCLLSCLALQVAERTISTDLEFLISKAVDINKADYAVITGVQVTAQKLLCRVPANYGKFSEALHRNILEWHQPGSLSRGAAFPVSNKQTSSSSASTKLTHLPACADPQLEHQL